MAALLELRGIHKAFGARAAARDVSLALGPGEAVLLVGRNGAGKTTLLRIATGFLDADAGTVLVDGVDLARDRPAGQARLGYLPEHAPAPAELAVREWLAARARLKRIGQAAVGPAIAAADLGEVVGQRIGTLSKGFRQRVGLADALLGGPRLLVLDEPTSGMDPVQVQDFRARLARLREAGTALLVSSHAVAELEPLATRLAVLRAGVLMLDQDAAEVRARGGLEAAALALMREAA